VIPTRIVPSSMPADLSPRQVAREFRGLVDEGLRIRPVGDARSEPELLLEGSYRPRYRVELFDTTFYLSRLHQNEDLRFFVAYVVQASARGGRDAFPRIFYKDVSLVWRSASHCVCTEDENWIGKGEVRTVHQDGEPHEVSAEETTDLPLEIQDALEHFARQPGRIPHDERAIELVLRCGPSDRMDPYRDFLEPRRRARSDPRNLINGGESVAWFTRPNDPASLRFAEGFEPDFGDGVLEASTSTSKLYHGAVQRFRILSANRVIQYLFFAGLRHVWIIPPQSTTTELSSFGVRTIDVIADEHLCVPGYEYHFMDDSVEPAELVSQIPEGHAGAPSEADPSRADASKWLDQLPVVQEFRRRVLAAGERS
jgi:hypothetical protein